MSVTLITPYAGLHLNCLEFLREFVENNECHYNSELSLAEKNFKEYLQWLHDCSIGNHLPIGYVPQTTFWLVENEEKILGTLRLRHYLTPNLEIEGGHIGYNIRPSCRRQGYGTLQLRLGLEKARRFHLERVLITCDSDNTASAKIIESNGGVLENYAVSPTSHKQISRYWIDLKPTD